MRIVYTDNFCRDYVDESFVNLPPMSESVAERIVEILRTNCTSNVSPDWWKVVPDDYEPRRFRP